MLVGHINKRLLPIPRLPFFRGGFDIGDVLFVQAHRIGNAAEVDGNQSVVTHSRDLSFKCDRIADFHLAHTGRIA